KHRPHLDRESVELLQVVCQARVPHADVQNGRPEVAVAGRAVDELAALGRVGRVEQAVDRKHQIEGPGPPAPRTAGAPARGPPAPRGGAGCPGDLRRELLESQAERIPAVTQLQRTAERSRRAATEP